MMERFVPRWADQLVAEAMEDTRVVFVMGPRQAGKSTMVTRHAGAHTYPTGVTLDDKAVRDAAALDPTGFVAGLPRPCLIDEVQRTPDLLLAIKAEVDRNRAPGQFLLTGSSNIKFNRKVKDALTGRIELITLWPLAQGEVHGTGGIIDGLFAGRPPMVQDAPVGHQAFLAPLAAGGYPEAMSRDDRRRGRWFRSYLETLLDRELRDLSDAQKLQEVPHLLRLVAAQSSGILNYQTIANRLQLNEKTVKAYLELLETAFITCRLPAWRPGLAAREVHAPKLHLVDTGLLLHVIGADEARLGQDPQVTGMALENFVAMEIVKQLVPAQVEATAYHYRFGRSEVDIVLESTAGDIVGIEVKASATPSHQDRLGLEKVRELAGDRFKLGMIVYTGRQTLPLGDRLWAVPVSGLWS